MQFSLFLAFPFPSPPNFFGPLLPAPYSIPLLSKWYDTAKPASNNAFKCNNRPV